MAGTGAPLCRESHYLTWDPLWWCLQTSQRYLNSEWHYSHVRAGLSTQWLMYSPLFSSPEAYRWESPWFRSTSKWTTPCCEASVVVYPGLPYYRQLKSTMLFVDFSCRWRQAVCYWDCILCALVPCIGELMALNTSRDDVLEVLHNYWGQCNSAVITLQVAADFLDTEAIMKDLGQTATWCDRLKLSETPPEKLQIGQQISHFTVWSDTLSGLAALLVLVFLSVELTWRGNYCSSSSER